VASQDTFAVTNALDYKVLRFKIKFQKIGASKFQKRLLDVHKYLARVNLDYIKLFSVMTKLVGEGEMDKDKKKRVAKIQQMINDIIELEKYLHSSGDYVPVVLSDFDGSKVLKEMAGKYTGVKSKMSRFFKGDKYNSKRLNQPLIIYYVTKLQDTIRKKIQKLSLFNDTGDLGTACGEGYKTAKILGEIGTVGIGKIIGDPLYDNRNALLCPLGKFRKREAKFNKHYMKFKIHYKKFLKLIQCEAKDKFNLETIDIYSTSTKEFNISAMTDPALCNQANLVKKFDTHASGFKNSQMAKRFEKTPLFKDIQKRNPDKLAKYEAKVKTATANFSTIFKEMKTSLKFIKENMRNLESTYCVRLYQYNLPGKKGWWKSLVGTSTKQIFIKQKTIDHLVKEPMFIDNFEKLIRGLDAESKSLTTPETKDAVDKALKSVLKPDDKQFIDDKGERLKVIPNVLLKDTITKDQLNIYNINFVDNSRNNFTINYQDTYIICAQNCSQDMLKQFKITITGTEITFIPIAFSGYSKDTDGKNTKFNIIFIKEDIINTLSYKKENGIDQTDYFQLDIAKGMDPKYSRSFAAVNIFFMSDTGDTGDTGVSSYDKKELERQNNKERKEEKEAINNERVKKIGNPGAFTDAYNEWAQIVNPVKKQTHASSVIRKITFGDITNDNESIIIALLGQSKDKDNGIEFIVDIFIKGFDDWTEDNHTVMMGVLNDDTTGITEDTKNEQKDLITDKINEKKQEIVLATAAANQAATKAENAQLEENDLTDIITYINNIETYANDLTIPKTDTEAEDAKKNVETFEKYINDILNNNKKTAQEALDKAKTAIKDANKILTLKQEYYLKDEIIPLKAAIETLTNRAIKTLEVQIQTLEEQITKLEKLIQTIKAKIEAYTTPQPAPQPAPTPEPAPAPAPELDENQKDIVKNFVKKLHKNDDKYEELYTLLLNTNIIDTNIVNIINGYNDYLYVDRKTKTKSEGERNSYENIKNILETENFTTTFNKLIQNYKDKDKDKVAFLLIVSLFLNKYLDEFEDTIFLVEIFLYLPDIMFKKTTDEFEYYTYTKNKEITIQFADYNVDENKYVLETEAGIQTIKLKNPSGGARPDKFPPTCLRIVSTELISLNDVAPISSSPSNISKLPQHFDIEMIKSANTYKNESGSNSLRNAQYDKIKTLVKDYTGDEPDIIAGNFGGFFNNIEDAILIKYLKSKLKDPSDDNLHYLLEFLSIENDFTDYESKILYELSTSPDEANLNRAINTMNSKPLTTAILTKSTDTTTSKKIQIPPDVNVNSYIFSELFTPTYITLNTYNDENQPIYRRSFKKSNTPPDYQFNYEPKLTLYTKTNLQALMLLLDKYQSVFTLGYKPYLKRDLGCFSLLDEEFGVRKRDKNDVKSLDILYTLNNPGFIESYLNKFSGFFNASVKDEAKFYSENQILRGLSQSQPSFNTSTTLFYNMNNKDNKIYNQIFTNNDKLKQQQCVRDVIMRMLLIPSEDLKKITGVPNIRNTEKPEKSSKKKGDPKSGDPTATIISPTTYYNPIHYVQLAQTFTLKFYRDKALPKLLKRLNDIINNNNYDNPDVSGEAKRIAMPGNFIEVLLKRNQQGNYINLGNRALVANFYEFIFIMLKIKFIDHQIKNLSSLQPEDVIMAEIRADIIKSSESTAGGSLQNSRRFLTFNSSQKHITPKKHFKAKKQISSQLRLKTKKKNRKTKTKQDKQKSNSQSKNIKHKRTKHALKL